MLHVEGLQRTAGSFRLRVHDWHVEQGAYVVIVGPSGAGKTMLLETIAGLYPLERGRVELDGCDVTRLPPERRGIGLVYQHCWLFPHLSVRQNIDFGRRYHRQGRRFERAASGRARDTEELAEMLRIAPLLDRRPEGLSGGERQRVALARALAIRPRLLFLDEPLGTLDPVTREHVATELVRWHRSFGMTTVHVTHDHTEARMVGDAVAVLLEGRLEQSGETGEVFRRPHTPALARFLGCENLIDAQAEEACRPGCTLVRLEETSFEMESPHLGSVVVCVRPEDLLLDEDDDAGHAGVRQSAIVALGRGSIVKASARGAQVRVIVQAGAVRWIALVSSSEWRRRGWSAGSPVSVRAPADTLHLIPSEAGPCN